MDQRIFKNQISISLPESPVSVCCKSVCWSCVLRTPRKRDGRRLPEC